MKLSSTAHEKSAEIAKIKHDLKLNDYPEWFLKQEIGAVETTKSKQKKKLNSNRL